MKNIRGEATRAELLTAIKMYYDKHGFSPTVRELGDMVGLKSTSTVQKHLKLLEKRGDIERNPSMPRTIVLKK